MSRLLLLLGKQQEFQPSDIPNLFMWLDASDIDTITKDASDLVSQWDDKSGNGKNAVAAGVTRPTYSETVFGSKIGLVYDGTNNFMTSGSAADWKFLHDSTGSSSYVVAATSESNPVKIEGFLATGQGSIRGSVFAMSDLSGTGDAVYTQIRNNLSQVVAFAIQDGVFTQQQITVVSNRYGTEDGPNNDLLIDIDGTQVASADNAFTPATINPSFPLYIGALAGGAYKLQGSFHEIIVFNRKLTDIEHNKIVNYLSNKWL